MPLSDPDWVEPIEDTFNVEKPIRSEQGLMFAGNPIAARMGKVGAPYERSGWHPYNGVTIGDSATGVIYDFAVHGAVTSVTTPDFEDGYEYRLDFTGATTAATTLRIELYRETSAAWSGLASVLTGAAGYNLTGALEIRAPRRSLRACRVDASFYDASGGGVAAHQWVNLTTSQKVLRARVSPESPYVFSAGAIRMMRRLAF